MGRIDRPRLAYVVLAGALVLGACGKDAKEEPAADAGDMASKVGQGVAAPTPQPGRWETVMKLESFDLPGMPPEAKAIVEKSMGDGKTFATCLTPEDSRKPPAEFFNRGRAGCRYESFRMAEGLMEGTMTCKEQMGTLKVALSGRYAADSYEVHTDARMAAPGGQEMAQTMTLKAHRAGDCKGDELNAKTAGQRNGA